MTSGLQAAMADLNTEQREAVLHQTGPLLILAGAGSGKTRVVTVKIAYLIEELGVDPRSILAVTFTNKAAGEMRERAAELVERAADVTIRTFHSFGAWMLRRNADVAGVPREFSIYDDDDTITLLHSLFPEHKRNTMARYARLISRAKDYCLAPGDDLSAISEDPHFPVVYGTYQSRLEEIGNVDFGDLIMRPVHLLETNGAVSRRTRERFRYILVDEYQDSNVAQFRLLRVIRDEHSFVCVVGDDDQSIYRFRGAEVRNILTFPDTFADTRVVRLEENYRSTAPILDLAGAVVACNEGRLGKQLFTRRAAGELPRLVLLPDQDDEVQWVIDRVRAADRSGQAGLTAVLYRTNAQSRAFETALLREGIGYRIVGSLRFYEREEVKDAVAFLRFVANPRDEVSFRRIINKPARGIGAKSLDGILAARADAGGDLHNAAQLAVDGLSKRARAGVSEFVELLTDLVAMVDAGGNEPAPRGGEAVSGGDEPVPPGGDPTSRAEDPARRAEDPARRAEDPARRAEDPARRGVEANNGGNAATPGGNAATPGGNAATPGGNAATSGGNAATPGARRASLADVVSRILEKSGLARLHADQDEIKGTQKLQNLEELSNAAGLYPATREGLVEFLEAIELDSAREQESTEDARVVLITMHNTKGLEFDRVIITGLEEGLFPRNDDPDELEEERRLFYVAITRARDEVTLVSCRARRVHGQYMDLLPSRFLGEIPRDLVQVDSEHYHGGYHDSFRGGHHRSRSGRAAAGGRRGGAPDRDDPDARWRRGVAVYHDDYGPGVVVQSRRVGVELCVDVRFETGMTGQFLPEYTSALERVAGDGDGEESEDLW